MNKFILAIILILVSLGLTFTFTRSNITSINLVKAEIASYDKALDQADQLTALKDDLMERFEEIPTDQKDRLEKFLPRNIDTVRLTIEIDSIADKNNVTIGSLAFAKNDSVDNGDSLAAKAAAEDNVIETLNIQQNNVNYSSVEMSFVANGSYSEIKSFISDLENNLRLTDIQSITMGSDAEEGMSADIVIRTYWLGT